MISRRGCRSYLVTRCVQQLDGVLATGAWKPTSTTQRQSLVSRLGIQSTASSGHHTRGHPLDDYTLRSDQPLMAFQLNLTDFPSRPACSLSFATRSYLISSRGSKLMRRMFTARRQIKKILKCVAI